jgi:hypothetical protein
MVGRRLNDNEEESISEHSRAGREGKIEDSWMAAGIAGGFRIVKFRKITKD